MNVIITKLLSLYELLKSQIVTFQIKDAIDIIIVTLILSMVIRFAAERRAGKLLLGIAVLVILRIVGGIFSFAALNFILDIVFQVGIVAIVVVFQPELRAGLEKIGGESLRGVKNIALRQLESRVGNEGVIDVVVNCVYQMSEEKRGALIVIEQNDNTERLVTNQETILDAECTDKLLLSIFYKNNELHDGAIIIRDGRIRAAACYFPMPETKHKKTELGTRHSAALGISEQSDAIVIVVSEQTGIVSLVYNKKMEREVPREELTNKLSQMLSNKKNKKASK